MTTMKKDKPKMPVKPHTVKPAQLPQAKAGGEAQKTVGQILYPSQGNKAKKK